ncbi:hypothetical protein ACIO6U_13290 [Streptomyces sp. NPDC087422]|uniref:hypothetical protein n=1 Tax=Streptomyces sp. NPDC087422 TaxID=3365786 RepID=UPI0038019E67
MAQAAGVAVVATAAAVVAAGPASAGTGAIYTTDGNPGGEAYYTGAGDTLLACDIQADGYRAFAEMIWIGSGKSNVVTVEDADGANGNCAQNDSANIPSGTAISITVCLKDGANGARKWCATEHGKAN